MPITLLQATCADSISMNRIAITMERTPHATVSHFATFIVRRSLAREEAPVKSTHTAEQEFMLEEMVDIAAPEGGDHQSGQPLGHPRDHEIG